MKKTFFTLSFLLLVLASWSQNQPIVITFSEVETRPGATFCVDVQATNFIAIQAVQFAVDWNSEVLHYQSVNIYKDRAAELPYIPNINENTDFGIHDGELRFLWAHESGAILEEKGTLFQICFQARGVSNTSIDFSDAIIGKAVRSDDLESIPVIGESATISIEENNTEVAQLNIGNADVEVGESFCLPITTQNIDALTSLQFALDWDETILEFSHINLEENPLQLTESKFNFDGDQFRMLWTQDSLQNISLSDTIPLFQICFDAMGEAGSNTEVRVGDVIPLEAVKIEEAEFVFIPIQVNTGLVQINGLPSDEALLSISNDIVTVEPLENFCIPITAYNFKTLAGLQFELTWDDQQLNFQEINPLNDPLSFDTFLPYALSDNSFKISWIDFDGQNITLPDSTVLFEMCFQAIGETETITEIIFGETLPLEASRITNTGVSTFNVSTKTATIFITNGDDAVLPGDTDLDGEVSHYDLINIGLGYGQTGPARENASIEFIPQAAEDWAISTPITSINYKHADTNGDGKINAEDTDAINLNWSAVPNLVTTVVTEDGVPFYVDTDTLRLIERNQLPIILGTENQPVEKIYSIAFSIYYEADVMLTEGLRVSLNNSWLGEEENELITVQRFFPNEKRIDVAISRIDQVGVTGFGEIGALDIVMEDVILFQTDGEVKFRIDHVQAIGEIQSNIAFAITHAVAKVQQQVTHTNETLASTISVYPNPASTTIYISSKTGQIVHAVLSDIFGKIVATHRNTSTLDVSELPSGIYFLSLQTNEGQITHKIRIK